MQHCHASNCFILNIYPVYHNPDDLLHVNIFTSRINRRKCDLSNAKNKKMWMKVNDYKLLKESIKDCTHLAHCKKRKETELIIACCAIALHTNPMYSNMWICSSKNCVNGTQIMGLIPGEQTCCRQVHLKRMC